MEFIQGGVTAPKGFFAGGVRAGVKPRGEKEDLALIYSEVPCSAAAVFTQNLVKAAPVQLSAEHLKDGIAQAVIANSGNANACNSDGFEKAKRMCGLVSKLLKIKDEDVLVASTGVIGQPLPIEPIEAAGENLVGSLSKDGSALAARAIMTTDTFPKEAALEIELSGKTVTLGGISKGSGMIHPNMGTMLCFVTADCAIASNLLKKAIRDAADETFNMLTVDGDTSTNDTFAVLSNGLAGNPPIETENEDFFLFKEALTELCRVLVRKMASDGEGASKLLTVKVEGAENLTVARRVAKSVAGSSLVKAAMFGEDANAGRVLCAAGYAGVPLDVDKIDVSFASANGSILVCRDGLGLAFDENLASKVLHAKEITILLQLHSGDSSAEAYGCDLTYDYVRINGDYRT